MGNNTLISNPMFEDWKPHPSMPDVFINSKNKKHVRRHLIVLQEREEQLLAKRMNETHTYIAKIEYFQKLETRHVAGSIKREAKYQIFTDSIYPIIYEQWSAIDSALMMLRGFRRLSTSYGFFRVCQDMVSMNEKYEIKVWINPNPTLSRLWQTADCEQKMLADITSIMMKYDSETGSLMAGCQNINEAMNNILMNLPENRVQSHLSNRTVTHDFRLKNKKNTSHERETKNIFRSTKQTEDEFPKPALDMDQFIEKNQSALASKKLKNSSIIPQSNLLHNVHLNKKPVYLTTFKQQKSPESQPQKYQSSNNYKKTMTEQTGGTSNLYCSENNLTKEGFPQNKIPCLEKNSQAFPTNHLNQSQPIGDTGHNTMIRQYDYKVQEMNHPIPNSNSFLTHYLSPVASQAKKTVEERFKQVLNPNIRPNYNRRSDLNREYIERIDEGRPSDFTGLSKYQKQYQQANSQEFAHKNGLSVLIPKEKTFNKTGSQQIDMEDINRNRTQQFRHLQKDIKNISWKKFGVQNRYLTKEVKEFKHKKQAEDQKIQKNSTPINFHSNSSTAKFQKVQSQKEEKQVIKQEFINQNRIQINKPTSNKQYKSNANYRQPGFREEPKSVPAKKAEKKISLPVTPVQQSPNQSLSNTYEEKKAMKQKLAKKLREELGGVLDTDQSQPQVAEVNDGNTLGLKYQKSAKDILIKKKVEEKKKHFAELKCEAMKLLID